MPDSGPQLPRQRSRERETIDLGMLPGLVGYNVRRAQIAVAQNFQSWMAPFDITPGQFGVLLLIRQNQGLSQSELGNALGIDRSTMVAVIDRLEGRGLVVRAPSPSDRRSYALHLSEQGESLLDQMVGRVEDHERAISGDLSEEEQATLISLLRRVAPDT